MQPENRKMVCPLCRKSITDALQALPTTRLCHSCRSIVQAIVPDRGWKSDSAQEARYFTPVAHTEVEAHTKYDEPQYLDADGLDDFGEGQYSDNYNQAQGITSSNDWPVADRNGNQADTGWQSGAQSQPERSSLQQEDRWAAPVAQTTGLAESPRWNQTLIVAPAPAEPEPIQTARPVYQAEPVYSHDPWASPLPDGETSLNEWPLLVHTGKKSSAKGLRAAIGVGVIAALGVAGYFFAYKPFFGSKQPVSQNAVAVNTATPTPTEEVADSAKPQPAAVPAESSAAPQVTPLSTSEKKEASASNDPGEGAFSLQAISSSSQEEANKFSEKLMRAGISAYVVAADIRGRGRWYRVRIGRFATREEAMKYGEQSRMRAKAAGIRLDLIVSSYDKP